MHQPEPSAATIPSGTVTGLGVADALRLDLLPIQLPALAGQLEGLRHSLEGALEHAEAAQADSDELEERRYALRLLDLMCARMPEASGGDRVPFAGPTGMVTEIVLGTLHDLADDLTSLLDDAPSRDVAFERRLRETSAALNAWVATYLDLMGVERFCVDPDADPASFW